MVKKKTKKSKNIRVALKVNGKKTKAKEIPSDDWLVTQRGMENKKDLVFSGARGIFTGILVELEGKEFLLEHICSPRIDREDKIIIYEGELRLNWGEFIVKKTKK